jgi:hypothetical protein
VSLSQLVAQTLLQFRADTSQARGEIAKLGEAEKKAAQEAVTASETRNAMYERVAAGITKLNVAMSVITKGVELAGQAWAAYDEQQDLAAAKGSISIDGLRRASRGLKTDLDLLKLAAVSQNTTFKLSQQQLEQATRAMRTFEEAGYDGAKVQTALENAIKKGSIEPLKELGVNLELARDSTGKYNQLLEVLAEKSQSAGDAELSRGDKMKQVVVSYQNTIRELKVAVGELVVAFQPVLKVVADVASALASLVKQIPSEILAAIAVGAGVQYGRRKLGAGRGKRGGLRAVAGELPLIGGFISAAAMAKEYFAPDEDDGTDYGELLREQGFEEDQQARDRAYEQQVATAKRFGETEAEQQERAAKSLQGLADTVGAARLVNFKRAAKGLNTRKQLLQVFAVYFADYRKDNKHRLLAMEYIDRIAPKGAGAGRRAALDELPTGEYDLEIERRRQGEIVTRTSLMFGAEVAMPSVPAEVIPLAESLQRQIVMSSVNRFAEQAQLKRRESKLAEMFGPIAEFNAYAQAFQALNTVATSAFQAWVDGAELTGAAMKKLAASALGSVAADMFGRSIQHAAYALGNLAFGLAGDPEALAASAVHAKSAAAFAAGAVVVGGLARKLGGGAESAAGASTAGGVAVGAGGAAPVGAGGAGRDMGRITNLYVGDVWGDDNPRTARQKFARSYRAARREMDSVGGVEFR